MLGSCLPVRGARLLASQPRAVGAFSGLWRLFPPLPIPPAALIVTTRAEPLLKAVTWVVRSSLPATTTHNTCALVVPLVAAVVLVICRHMRLISELLPLVLLLLLLLVQPVLLLCSMLLLLPLLLHLWL